jgi:hypothetical protein
MTRSAHVDVEKGALFDMRSSRQDEPKETPLSEQAHSRDWHQSG